MDLLHFSCDGTFSIPAWRVMLILYDIDIYNNKNIRTCIKVVAQIKYNIHIYINCRTFLAQ